jgi:hypothetical protein
VEQGDDHCGLKTHLMAASALQIFLFNILLAHTIEEISAFFYRSLKRD